MEGQNFNSATTCSTLSQAPYGKTGACPYILPTRLFGESSRTEQHENTEILRPVSNIIDADICYIQVLLSDKINEKKNGQTLVEQNNKSRWHLTCLSS